MTEQSTSPTLAWLQDNLVFVPAPFGTLRVTGDDRISWLNGLITSDLAKAKTGDLRYGVAVQKNGKILSELWAVLRDDALDVAVPRDRIESIRDHLDGYLIMEDAEIEVAPIEWLLAYGQPAKELLESARNRGLFTASTRRMEATVTAFVGEAEAMRAFETEHADRSEVHRFEGEAFDDLRVALGIGLLGTDFDESNYPQEAALEMDGVSFDKGCYLGQEAVFMLQHRGHVKKRLVQLEAGGGSLPAVGTVITDASGTEQGTVTSIARPSSREPMCLGWVRYKQAKPGTELDAAGVKLRVTPRLAL